MTRTNAAGDHIILCIRGRGDLVGEEVLGDEDGTQYETEVEILTPANVYRIPRAALRAAFSCSCGLGAPIDLIYAGTETCARAES